MATVYSRVNGDPIQRLIARTQAVQTALSEEAANGARRARARLMSHRESGDSFIEVEKGHIDRYVTLNDERGQGAAMSMEVGHYVKTKDGLKWVEGIHVLSNAFKRGG